MFLRNELRSRKFTLLILAIVAIASVCLLWGIGTKVSIEHYVGIIQQLQVNGACSVDRNLADERWMIQIVKEKSVVLRKLKPPMILWGYLVPKLELEMIDCSEIDSSVALSNVESVRVTGELDNVSDLKKLRLAFPNCRLWQLRIHQWDNDVEDEFSKFPSHSAVVLIQSVPDGHKQFERFGTVMIDWASLDSASRK